MEDTMPVTISNSEPFCPYCNSKNIRNMDTVGSDKESYTDIGKCADCGKEFYLIFEVVAVMKKEE